MRYEKVIEDYRSGAINKDDWQLIFDNDGGYWRYTGDLGFECSDCGNCKECETLAIFRALKVDRYGEPNGYQDLVDIAVAAGINADWC